MDSSNTVIIIILVFGLIFSFINSGVKFYNNMNITLEEVDKALNTIAIEEEEIDKIQERMKDVIKEYVDHEENVNITAMKELDPKVLISMYPDLKSSSMFNQLNRQYLNSMRKIKMAKEDHNKLVSEYNSKLVTLKGRILGRGRQKLEYYR